MDAWTTHLESLGLAELDKQAQKVNYRVRCATVYQFDLEYMGGSIEHYNRGIKTFTDMAQAQAYLARVKAELETIFGPDEDEEDEPEEAPYDDRAVPHTYDPIRYQ